MLEGWQGDDYVILFDETESADFSAKYEIGKHIAGYLVVGLKGWDDFILRGADGQLATVPTVPIVAEHVAPLEIQRLPRQLQPDSRFRGKVKWYTQPIVFGGDPLSKDNTTWISLEEHIRLVKWWNDRYQQLKSPP
jgi:hypothetical protein